MPPKQPSEEQSEVWSSIKSRIDGRFRWSDGRENQQDPWQVVTDHFE